MAIPAHVTVKNGALPPNPGVYLMKDAAGKLLYIGKATSLRTRVGSYFVRPADARIAKMVTLIRAIDYQETPTAVEALMLESKLIKKHQPPYNVMEKDDKSFVHLAFTREPFPKPVLIRAYELARMPKRQFLKVYGPFGSAASVRASLDALRKSFPWTACRPGQKRPCFYRHLGLCPGVCTGEITSAQYKKIIRRLTRFFEGGRATVVKEMQAEMKRAAKEQRYEDAAELRNRLFALDHVRDATVLKDEGRRDGDFIDIFGRVEAYDISNISGKDAVGSMTVLIDGEPKKSEYRIFGIKDVQGPNDVAMMAETLRRRFARSVKPADGNAWPLPDLVLIDGGAAQMQAAKSVLDSYGLKIPLVGIAKGPDRKQDELVYDKSDYELSRLVHAFKPLLQRVRDEAHRFAVSWHRKKRAKSFLA